VFLEHYIAAGYLPSCIRVQKQPPRSLRVKPYKHALFSHWTQLAPCQVPLGLVNKGVCHTPPDSQSVEVGLLTMPDLIRGLPT
jgi:hypothetical protein